MNKRYLSKKHGRQKFQTGRGRLRQLYRCPPQTVVIDRLMRVRLPWGVPDWRVGQRVFWKARNKSAAANICPKGMLSKGRYFSGRVQRFLRRK